MMNYLSRFRALVLAVLLASSGASGSAEIRPVQPGAYASRACWRDARGNLVAFLVLGREDRFAVPYLVSTRCMVAGYGSFAEATMNRLNTIRLADRYHVLQRAFPQFTILDNVATDLALPSGDSMIYLIRLRVTRVPHPYLTVYAPRKMIEFTETNMSFFRFLHLSEEERDSFARQYERGHSPLQMSAFHP